MAVMIRALIWGTLLIFVPVYAGLAMGPKAAGVLLVAYVIVFGLCCLVAAMSHSEDDT